MKKNIQERVFERLLREAIDLGKIEFSPDRMDDVATTEPNTPNEERLHKMLTTWFEFGDETPGLAQDLMSAAEDPRYQDFFHWMPDGVTLYRGLNMEEESLARMLGVDLADLESLGGRWDEPFTVKPRGGGGVMSWTTDFDSAEKFAKLRRRGLCVVLSTVTGPETGRFIDAAAMTEKVASWMEWRVESEAMALGPIRATGADWWRSRR